MHPSVTQLRADVAKLKERICALKEQAPKTAPTPKNIQAELGRTYEALIKFFQLQHPELDDAELHKLAMQSEQGRKLVKNYNAAVQSGAIP